MSEYDTNWVHFTVTHWTLVLSARNPESRERQQAMESLCRSYWPPIYAYIRQQGHCPIDAQDLTQEFFARLLEKDYLKSLVHRNGKFRSFLLACVNHMLGDERDKKHALKRGGGCSHIPLGDFQSLEAELMEVGSEGGASINFDLLWARTVLRRGTDRLAEHYRSRGKLALFNELKAFAPGSEEEPAYEIVAARLGMTGEALRAAVHRMRVRFGQLIRAEVSHTLSDPAELESEIRYLIEVVSES